MTYSFEESDDAAEMCTTMHCLAELSFTPRRPEYTRVKLGYKLVTVDLGAQEMTNRWLVPIVSISSVLKSPRTIAIIDVELPTNLYRPAEAAAFLVFGLQHLKNDLGPLPHWWEVGEASLHLHPVVQKQKAAKERAQAYTRRPHCVLIGDHARLFRQHLRAAISELEGPEVTWVTFDGHVLRVDVHGRKVQALAQGDGWQNAILWPVSPAMKLPARFTGPNVQLGYFEGQLDIDVFRYPAVEVDN